MKSIKRIFAVWVLLLTLPLLVSQAIAAPENAERPEYTVLQQTQPTHSGNKIEVLEFFFYGCSHCYNLQPAIMAMEKDMPKDVALVFVPTIFADSMEPMARTFYALEALGELNRVHNELFNAWHVQMIDLRDEEKIANYLAQFKIDRRKFSDAYHAFSTQSKVARSKQLVASYGVRGTPTMTVDGKYLVTGWGSKETMRIVNSLIQKIRKERARQA